MMGCPVFPDSWILSEQARIEISWPTHSVIDKIADYFISNQKNGIWFNDDINASYDQSAEIACWFFDIIKNLNSF
jgi:hypothetical protein